MFAACWLTYVLETVALMFGMSPQYSIHLSSNSSFECPSHFFITAKLYLPKVNRSSGAAVDMWIKVLALSLSLSLSLYIYIYICTLVTNFFQAKELDANTETYIELLAKGTGKPKEEIAKDTQRPKYLQAQEAIEYGLADKIINKEDNAFEKRVMFHSSLFLRSFKDSSPHVSSNYNFSAQNYDELLAKSRAMRGSPGAGPLASPSGFR